MSNGQLKSFVERIENLDAEQKGIGTDKRTVFDEAAAAGYDKKAIRRLLRDRREAAKDQGTAELAEQYKMLLSEPGATYRSVAEKTGAKRSTLHRLVPKSARGTNHDPETGEVEVVLWEGGIKNDDGHSTRDAAPEGRVDGRSVVCLPTETIVPPNTTPQADEAASLSVTPVPDEGVGAGTLHGDGLDLPPFLDRRNGLPPAQKPEDRGCSGRPEGTQ